MSKLSTVNANVMNKDLPQNGIFIMSGIDRVNRTQNFEGSFGREELEAFFVRWNLICANSV